MEQDETLLKNAKVEEQRCRKECEPVSAWAALIICKQIEQKPVDSRQPVNSSLK